MKKGDGDLFDFAESKRRGEEGAKRAAKHAERVNQGWIEKALAELRALLPEGTFMAEQIRVAAYARGLERPPDNRAWGEIMKRAARAGLIVQVGYGRSRLKNCHANPKGLWKRGTPQTMN